MTLQKLVHLKLEELIFKTHRECNGWIGLATDDTMQSKVRHSIIGDGRRGEEFLRVQK